MRCVVSEAAVAHYRMFLLDGRGHILAREEFEASDDGDAIAKARAMFGERAHYSGFEVWQLSRVVHREDRR
jgi:hypothetical protein